MWDFDRYHLTPATRAGPVQIPRLPQAYAMGLPSYARYAGYHGSLRQIWGTVDL
jgi:hypothetical protein